MIREGENGLCNKGFTGGDRTCEEFGRQVFSIPITLYYFNEVRAAGTIIDPKFFG